MKSRIPLAAALLLLLQTASAQDAGSGQRLIGSLSFAPCEIDPRGAAAPYRAECAKLPVPMDPAQPDAGRISLRIVLIATKAARPDPDPVVLLAGGPGQAATDAWAGAQSAFAEVARRRHVFLIDQRGTGQSHPLECEGLGEIMGEFETPSAEQFRKLAEHCVPQFDADPRFFTTSEAVSDLEQVRRVLSIPQWNLYAGSYGTRVAIEYLRRHPDSIRSAVLDGVVPPSLALGQEHAQNLDEALAKLFAACIANDDCKSRFGDPGDLLAGLRASLGGSTRNVGINDPYTHEPREIPLGASTLAAVVRMFAYSPESHALLPLLLDEASKGRPQPLLSQAALLRTSIGSSLSIGLQFSVTCSEDAPRMNVRESDAQRLLGNALVEATLAVCAVWPSKPAPQDFNAALESDRPVLLLSGEFDPVTPPRYAEEVAATLSRARHLVATGQGHIVATRGCMPQLMGRFMDSLDPAALDADCLDALRPAAAFIDFQGSAP